MSKIPTAKQFVKKYEREGFLEDRFIEFAKLHVEAALDEASKSKSTYVKYDLEGNRTHPTGLNKNSVLNAYPLDNIK